MSETVFRLEVVTPNRLLVSEEVNEATAPGVEGEFGVLVGHTPFLTSLGMGELMYRTGGQDKHNNDDTFQSGSPAVLTCDAEV